MHYSLPNTRLLRKTLATGFLEQICRALELTDTQFQTAQDRYGAVGGWLDDESDPALRHTTIYPQGSLALGTTVRPLGREDYDLDLVCLVPGHAGSGPADLKKRIGDRLRSHAYYKSILHEKTRCWRLSYANEFHLDITPSVPNDKCSQGGELVPDKRLHAWKPTNPRGYRAWFERRADLLPRLAADSWDANARAEVEMLPTPTRFRGVLRRCVQLCKRHRDCYFSLGGSVAADLAPISVILTTLAAKSYADCVGRQEYETEYDLLSDVVCRMPDYIETRHSNGGSSWFVWNETTQGENFAERWNLDPRRASAFFMWHEAAVDALRDIVEMTGQDEVSSTMFRAFGDVGRRTVRRYVDTVSEARRDSRLRVAAGAGIVTRGSGSTQVRRNTFYGGDVETRNA